MQKNYRPDPPAINDDHECELIREQCQAGIDRAKAKGTKFGRPSKLDPGQRA